MIDRIDGLSLGEINTLLAAESFQGRDH